MTTATLTINSRNYGAWSLRVYIKPFIRWIWLGALLMMLGGFIAAADRRFRSLALARETNTGTAPTPAPAPAASLTAEAS